MIFNFKQFLKRYEQPLTVIEAVNGQYDENTGQWIPGEETEIELNCPVVPLTDDELVSAEGGNYTNNDRKIFIHRELKRGQEIVTGGKRYVVDREKDYSKYASGLRVYIIVRKGEIDE